MARLSILFLVVCAGCLLDQAVGFNYYIQTGNSGFMTYPLLPPLSAIWGPDCDKKKGGESSESSSGEKGEGSSESSGEEGKESKESGEGSKEEKSEESGSKEEGEKKEGSEESGEKKEGSEESGEKKEGSEESGEKKEGSEESGESGEKKKEEKKKKYIFPARTYDFPPSKVQQIMYAPVSSYSYLPYQASYVVQQPVAPYPVKSSYRYVSVPAVNSYTAPVLSRLVNSPVTKIVYSSGLSYPQVPKTVVSSAARVYSIPGSWNSGVSYYKK